VIIFAVMGLITLLMPQLLGTMAGVKILEPETFRTVGAAMLAFATGSALAYRQKSWEKVKIIVIMEIVFGVLAALALIWGLITGALPVSDWSNVVITGGLTVAFIVFYFKK
jgi:hypothetical protein